MNTPSLNKANIENLTCLWKNYGSRPPAGGLPTGFHVSTSWPHRGWFDWDADIRGSASLDRLFSHLPRHIIVPVWKDTFDHAAFLEQQLSCFDFTPAFDQTAMYLKLDPPPGGRHYSGDIVPVQEPDQIETWARISGMAFGYEIDVAVILNIAEDPNVRLYLAYCEGRAAGTAMLYRTEDIIGIHQVGVIPELQGKGIAFNLMRHAIQAGAALRARHLTLQASAAAEKLYQRLGFNRQFSIRNYQRMA